jgi:hypothetical protein
MPSCRKSPSGLHEYYPVQTSPSAASSRILRAALPRSLAEGRMAMSSLRQPYESSNSSSGVPQPIRGRFRGQPDHFVFGLSWMSARRKMKIPGRRKTLLATRPIAISNVRTEWRDALDRRACRRGLVNNGQPEVRRIPSSALLAIGCRESRCEKQHQYS